nr:MAG TPA: head tail connector [Caudoviricetes sp.]
MFNLSLDDEKILEKIKFSCRIDDDIFNDELEELKLAAELYLKNAGINKNYENKLYLLAIKKLVKHWYDNDIIGSNTNELPYGLDSIINQLQIHGLGEKSEIK